MPLIYKIQDLLSRASRACGFDTVDAFPPGHAYARTRWNPAYFDIPSDLKPDDIERRMCEAIANTPSVFAYIVNPTPRMQRTLIGMIEATMRRSCSEPAGLASLLINAYASPHIPELAPGLRAVIQGSAALDMGSRTRLLLLHLNAGADALVTTIEN